VSATSDILAPVVPNVNTFFDFFYFFIFSVFLFFLFYFIRERFRPLSLIFTGIFKLFTPVWQSF